MSRLNPSSEAFHPSPSLCEVWTHNLRSEILHISKLLDRYNVVSMDTEFPGVLYRLEGDCPDLLYQSIRVNVNATKVIQVGISIADEQGEAPDGICTWQFNLHFDLNTDDYASDSIDLLTRAGLNLVENAKYGIEPAVFAEHLMVSGLVLNEDVRWVTFHGAFDFAYFLRTLTARPLPDTETSFLQELSIYFPRYYDVKQMVRQDERFRGGLSRLAELLRLTRLGTAHQAGSDAVVTLACFFALRKDYFGGEVPVYYLGVLYGLGSSRPLWNCLAPCEESWRLPNRPFFEVSISN